MVSRIPIKKSCDEEDGIQKWFSCNFSMVAYISVHNVVMGIGAVAGDVF